MTARAVARLNRGRQGQASRMAPIFSRVHEEENLMNWLARKPWRRACEFLVLALTLLTAIPAVGQSTTSRDPVSTAPAAAGRTETAPVVVDGETLFHVGGISAFPATQRAAAIAARIREVAADAA